jgi:putative tryptophan/tyrosine transport system substrate-binding protein
VCAGAPARLGTSAAIMRTCDLLGVPDEWPHVAHHAPFHQVTGRREFLAFIAAGLSLAPAPARGQQRAKVSRVGVLSPFDPSDDAFLAVFRQGLRELGHVEGQNLTLEYRAADGATGRLLDLAADLARLRVDLIATTGPAGVQAAKQATKAIPIVMAGVDDAVDQGFVASLSRPGGNVTGASWLNGELSAKRLEFLKEALPSLSRVALLREAAGGAASLRATNVAARSLKISLHVMEIRQADELESAFGAIVGERVGAVIVHQGPMLAARQRQVLQLAARNRLPAMFSDGRLVDAGGLMSYGPRLVELYRDAASYADRILKGARPADLPVEQPTRFELCINMRTARMLGLALPTAILVRADRLIQ